MSASDIVGLAGQITGVLVPTIGALVLAVVNFINHHTHSKATQANMAKIAAIEGKVMSIDTDLQNHKDNIAIGVDAATGIVPGLGTTLKDHIKNIQDISAKIADLNAQLQKLQSAIPTDAATTTVEPVKT